MLFCIAVSLYPVWADVDAIYQVLKQAGEIRGNSTNSPPTPPTAEHLPSGAAPLSARASSHPCSSSTSGKAHHQTIPADLGTHVGVYPEILPWTVADYVCIRHSYPGHQNKDRILLLKVYHSSLINLNNIKLLKILFPIYFTATIIIILIKSYFLKIFNKNPRYSVSCTLNNLIPPLGKNS